MSHLGALVTPYLDGELDAVRSAEANAHLGVCGECRMALALEQAARTRTRGSARDVLASPELMARLLAMPAAPVPPSSPERPRRAPFVLGGGAALVGLFVLTLFVLGGPRPETSPSAVLSAATPQNGALASPQAASLVSNADLDARSDEGWVLPSDLAVARLDVLDDGATQTLDVTLTTAQGQVRLLERSGSIDPDAPGALLTTIAGRTVHEVDDWYVLESDTYVVAVSGETEAAAAAVIAALPGAAPEGFLGRIGAGWDALVG